MAHILIIGGGLAGCTAAWELSKNHHKVTIIEKCKRIGGKVREYGCKATDKCSNCGICLPGGLWESVENSDIEIITQAKLTDITGTRGNFTAILKTNKGYEYIHSISRIIVSIGFERPTERSLGNLEVSDDTNLMSGFEIEKYISNRKVNSVLPAEHESIAFIQCFGSRDIQEKALYCSRVCCGYSTRAARVLKHFNPDLKVSFFYMDLQYVEDNQYFEVLTNEGFEFIKCRPARIRPGKPCIITYENAETCEVVERKFDLIVLSEGIHPAEDSELLAELCTLGIDDSGFLKYVGDASKTGIYITGCASGPKSIEEVHNESITAARQLMSHL